MSHPTFEFVCSLHFSSDSLDEWRFPGGRIEDHAEAWTRDTTEPDELRAVIDEVGAFLESKPSERDCRAFLDESGADIRMLETRDMVLLAFLKFWHRLAKQQLASFE